MQSISVTWYSEICWFPVKKCRCQQNLKSVSRDSYIFSIFFRKGITVTSFIIAGHVWQISGRGSLFALPRPLIREKPQKSPSWIGLRNAFSMWVSLTTFAKHLTLDVSQVLNTSLHQEVKRKKFLSFHLSFGDQNTFPNDLVTGNSDFNLRENFL